MNRSELLKLMFKINRIFNKLNKYFYILPLISILTNIFNNKYLIKINKFIKIIIFINIILGVSLIVLFTDLITPLNITYSIYSDIIEPYIELLKHLWDQIKNYINISAGPVNPEIDLTNIQSEIKLGIKQGVKEAISEVLEEMRDELTESQGNSELLKQIALISSGLFYFYFIFILPGSSISPAELVQYNWFNHSLIELKINIINLLFNPGNPGNPGSPITLISPIEIIDSNITRSMVEVGVSPISPISEGSVGLSTVTPNSPIQTISEYIEASTQTDLGGLEVSRSIGTVSTLISVFPEATSSSLTNAVNSAIKNITD